MSLAVILVHYHAATWLAAAVAALRRDLSSGQLDAEIIVVDNGSRPEDRELMASLGVRCVDAGGNRGYAGGINLGVEQTSAERLVLMNPDVEVQPGCLTALLAQLSLGAAAAGPRFYWDRGQTLLLPPTELRTRGAELLRSLARRDPRLAPRARRAWRRHARRHWNAREPLPSCSLSGALLALHRRAWEQVGPFDPGYKLYFEENDWLARAHSAGLRLVHVPAAAAVHHYNRSAAAEPQAATWFDESARKFAARHYGRWFSSLQHSLPPLGRLDEWRARLSSASLRRAATPAGPAKLWVEISPSPLGFPAASGMLADGCRDWQPAQALLERLDPGHYSVRIVSDAGEEIGASDFHHEAAVRQAPPPPRADAISVETAPRLQPPVAVTIVTPASLEHSLSAELTFATSWLGNQVRKVFGESRLCSPEGEPANVRIPESPYVLILGSAAVVCTARTLDLLKQALDGGASAAVPHSLAAFPQLLDPPPFSLSDYDRLEARVVELAESPAPVNATQLPICLCTRAFFLTLLRRFTLSELLTRVFELAEVFPTEPVARIGLYYVFNDYYGETRKDVLPHLPANPRNILDIGCGRGFTGQYLEAELGCRVTGVELNPAIAEDARRRLSRVLVGDAQSIPLEGPYDAIIATELVEHLTEPEVFLRRVMSALSPGGRLVLSIPNVGHHSVVADLMAGRWDYLPAGLLCWTHVRFYTCQGLVDLLERSGLQHFRIIRQESALPDPIKASALQWGADLASLRTQGFWVVVERGPEKVGPFEIRPYEPGDERSINEAFNQIFNVTRSLDEWRWKFRATPDASRIIVAVNRQQEVVAQCALQLVELQVNGEEVLAGHSVDAFCRHDADAVQHGVYVRTVRAMSARHGGSELGFVFGFPGKRAMRLGRQRLEFEQPIDVPVWRRSTEDRNGVLEPGSGYAIEPTCGRFDADRIWRRAAARYAVSPIRDGRWLHRRYLDRPGHTYRSFTVFEQDMPRAWAILRVSGSLGQWVELVWDGDDPRALICLDRAVGAAARDAGADRLELWLSGDAAAEDVFRTGGWVRGRHEAELQMTTVLFNQAFESAKLLSGFYLTMGVADLV